MTTFNVDSLDFADDETVQQGAAPDFKWGFDSANTRLELEDLTNATTSYVPQGRSGDLVDGRFAETVAEGKVLADNGSVYDDISTAYSNASSYIKVGPGTFSTFLDMDTNGISVIGSGEQTVLTEKSGNPNIIRTDATDNVLAHMKIKPSSNAIDHIRKSNNDSDFLFHNLSFIDGNSAFLGHRQGDNHTFERCRFVDNSYRVELGVGDIVKNCYFENVPNRSLYMFEDNVVANNKLIDCATDYGSITVWADDNVVISNRVHGSGFDGISVNGTDNIVANNRVSNSGVSDIQDNGTGTVLDANLTGSAN